jgi:hypothetical protein
MELWNKLSNFTKEISKNRDISHNYEHFLSVTNTSILIFNKIEIENNKKDILFNILISVAWLHDIIDHKYTDSSENKVLLIKFLNEIFSNDDTLLILNIIERISYSKENYYIINNKNNDWNEILGEDGLLIRNIVSDADKLDALGKF